jgi:hypothetical protein
MSGTPQKTPLKRQNALIPEQIQAAKQIPNPFNEYTAQQNKKLIRTNSYTVENGKPIKKNFGSKQQGKGRSRKLKRKTKKTKK